MIQQLCTKPDKMHHWVGGGKKQKPRCIKNWFIIKKTVLNWDSYSFELEPCLISGEYFDVVVEYKLVIEWLEERNEVGLEEAQCTKLIPLLSRNPRNKQITSALRDQFY